MYLTEFVLVPFLIILTTGCCVGRPLPSKLADGTKQPLQTSRPYNIAHRGSNGEFPEETAAAYMVYMPPIYIWFDICDWKHKLGFHIC